MRNGDGQPRRRRLSLGTRMVRRPRVRGVGERFVRRVLPWLQRRTRQGGAVWAQRYLHGWALGDFELARRGLLGEGAPLSAASLARLQARWQREYAAWKQRRRADLAVGYGWADGVSGNAGRAATTAALLGLLGGVTTGQQVVLAVESGPREANDSWGAVLRALRARGRKPWRWTIADGHLGSWAAWGAPQPTAAAQRGWNPRRPHVLAASPTTAPAQARTLRCAMP